MLNFLLDLRGATIADFAEGKRKDDEPGTRTISKIPSPRESITTATGN